MCGRFYLPENDLSEELDMLIQGLNHRESVSLHGEISPGNTIAALANSRQGTVRAFGMRWGYTLQGKLVFNARSESALEKPLFRDGMLNRRCLIPAFCYFEWEKHDTGKQKYALKPEGCQLFFLAGIYRIIDGIPECSILTAAPASNITFIHDRMPVMFPLSMNKDWLNNANDPDRMLQGALRNVEYRSA